MPVRENIKLPTEPVVIIPEEPGEIGYTTAMLEFLENSGLIEGRYELIEGKIYSKMGQNLRHSQTVAQLMRYLDRIEAFQERRVVSDTSIDTGTPGGNQPAPDVIVLRESLMKGKPLGTDVLLAIEVSDTTQTRDLQAKPPVYAGSGIAEYWVLDLPRRTITTYRNPDVTTGIWGTTTTLAETQTVAPESAPEDSVKVSDLLPPVE